MIPLPPHGIVNQLTAGGRYPNGNSSAGADCTVACGVMAVDAWTRGAVDPTTTELRGRQHDQSGGIGLDDLADAFRSWGITTWQHGPRLWAQIMSRLRSSDGVVLQGWSGSLGRYCVGHPVGHAIYCLWLASNGDIVVMDPLRHAPIAIPASVVRRFYLSGLAQAGWFTGTYSHALGGTTAGRTTTLAAYAGIAASRADNLNDVIRELVILDTGQPNRPPYGGKFAREQIARGFRGAELVARANTFLQFATMASGTGANVLGVPTAPFSSGKPAGLVLLPVLSDGSIDIDAMSTQLAAGGGFDPLGLGQVGAAITAAAGQIPLALAQAFGDVGRNLLILAGAIVILLMGLYLVATATDAPGGL